jgi:hypothetical protein
MKVGNLVRFSHGKIIGLVADTKKAKIGFVQVLWMCEPDRLRHARIERLEVISEGG